MNKNVTVVLDSQAGSCGKGKFIGYLAIRDRVDLAINNFMSNAGHTWVSGSGEQVMTQHLPTSMVNHSTILVIGPGAAITPSILFSEILKYRDIIGDRHIYINPRAVVIRQKHCEYEKSVLRSGSTFKGCGAAQADKVMRQAMLFGEWYTKTMWDTIPLCEGTHLPDHTMSMEQARYILDTIKVTDTMGLVNDIIDCRGSVMVEGSQGCDLDINYGLDYPNTTSRQCHAGQLVADCGISPRLVNDIIMIMRPYPIRISNITNIGIEVSSGEYAGSDEITWNTIKERCGAPDDEQLGEYTTVTKKMRRVFEMNWNRLRYVSILNRPTQIALNFAQYIDWKMLGKTSKKDITDKVRQFISGVEDVTGVPVTMIGTGSKNNEIIDLRG